MFIVKCQVVFKNVKQKKNYNFHKFLKNGFYFFGVTQKLIRLGEVSVIPGKVC